MVYRHAPETEDIVLMIKTKEDKQNRNKENSKYQGMHSQLKESLRIFHIVLAFNMSKLL
jgi:hypothetical protein